MFLTAIGLLTLYLANQLGTIVSVKEGCGIDWPFLGPPCNATVVLQWAFYVEIAGAIVLAVGLAVTVYGALKKS